MKLKRVKSKEQKRSFSNIELIVSISIMLVLGGVFILNYRSHTGKVELNNAANVMAQEIRKAQDLTMAQVLPPSEGCEEEGLEKFGVFFEKEKNYVELYVNRDNIGDMESCLVEERYFSSAIKIAEVTPEGDTNIAWVNFEKEDLKTIINNSNAATLSVDLCIKSDCTEENTKTVIVNKKGMVDIQ